MEEKVHESCIDLLSVLKDEFANSARWTLRLMWVAMDTTFVQMHIPEHVVLPNISHQNVQYVVIFI